MRKFINAVVISAISLATVPSFAADKITGVVELFTSQGCSSCPPADRLLEKLADRPTILALAWHVDYWDYLGWRDTLGLAEATSRQKNYATSFKSNSIYTPQAVINGATGLVGSKGGAIDNALNNTPFIALDLTLKRADQRLIIDLQNTDFNGSQALIELISFEPKAIVDIERGENAGEAVTYRNAVKSVANLGVWNGKARQIEVPIAASGLEKGKGAAVLIRTILSTGEPGPIIGAGVVDPA